MAKDSALGREVKAHMDAGRLAPDELVTRAVRPVVEQLDGYILDGYPRTRAQAEGLDFDAVVYLNVGDEEVIRRLLARGRHDDRADVIKERLREYDEDTEPLIDHYADVLVEVDGDRDQDEIAADIKARPQATATSVGMPASARAERRSASIRWSTSGSGSPLRTAARI